MTHGPHPARCEACRGSGQADGPPLTQTIGGRPHTYTTVKRCDHDWWNDDPSLDEPLEREHPRAQATFARGYAQGLADLDVIRNGKDNA